MINDLKYTLIIFGVPISLLILTISIFFMVNLTNVSDAINSTIIPERVQNVIHYSFDIGIFLGLTFGLFSIAFAIWFGYGGKLRDFLTVSKKSEIDQKIAMMYGYAEDVRKNWKDNFKTDLKIERILADIRSVGRLKKAIKDEQKEYLISAKNRFLVELREKGYNLEANRIEEVFVSYLW
jgi:hypothetical protein